MIDLMRCSSSVMSSEVETSPDCTTTVRWKARPLLRIRYGLDFARNNRRASFRNGK